MCCWRRMEKIEWSEKVTNEEVLERIQEKRTLQNNVRDHFSQPYSTTDNIILFMFGALIYVAHRPGH